MSTRFGERLGGLRPHWMRRYDVSWVEVVFCVAVLAGGVGTLLAPSRVASVVQLTGAAATHPLPALLIGIIVVAVFASRWARVWGPVRVSRAVARWTLSGPAPRGRVLGRHLARVGISSILVCLCGAALLGLLRPDLMVASMIVGGTAGLTAAGAAYLAQVVDDRRRGIAPPLRELSPATLHRRTIAPTDGYSGALGLTVSTMDVTWLTDARVVRWQRCHLASRGPRLVDSPTFSLVQLDFRRLRRHPDSVIRALLCLMALMVIPQALLFRHGSAVVVAALAYCAGNSVTDGLRTAGGGRALRRALALDDRTLWAAHMVVPGVVVAIATCIAALAWPLPGSSVVVLFVGSTIAVLRRATRPPLPYDSVVVNEPLVTGASVQPFLLTTQARGLVAMAVTAAAVSMLG
ncbi:DUF6297 family protein [Gordonia sp. N1V]|uniref:DUF6297 family protein n=1 Tax=Gordonia sp. N1V TaxID=3034163 RepID=UPI0023E34A97|nr:DUF6297 family protein [Gordonia sp. N1V]MDF3282674.1 DUF6297 family protein [Gordonia sp. N1V]